MSDPKPPKYLRRWQLRYRNDPPLADKPTILSPFVKPERVVGSHFPPIPDQSCVCAYPVPNGDLRLCTKWVAAPSFVCLKGTLHKCEKFGPHPVQFRCPCVHADNRRQCYDFAPPGTNVPSTSAPQPGAPSVSSVSAPSVSVGAGVTAPATSQKMTATLVNGKRQTPLTAWDRARIRADALRRAHNSEFVRRMRDEIRAFHALRREAERAAAQTDAITSLNSGLISPTGRIPGGSAAAASSASKTTVTPLVDGLSAVIRSGAVSRDRRITLNGNGNRRQSKPLISVAATEYDKDILTRTVWGEAKYDDEIGKRGVAWTLINRARDKRNRFAKSIADVCRGKSDGGGQLRSWRVNSKKLMALSRSDPAYRDIRRIVDQALSGARSDDPINGGQFYYYNGRISPRWAVDMECGYRSKTHTFCKSREQPASVA